MNVEKASGFRETSIDVKKTRVVSFTMLLISILYVIFVIAWILTSNKTVMAVMEILTVWAAIVIVQFMAELYRGCSANRKSQGLTALILSVCMATVTITNHFIYITVLNQLYSGKDMPSWLQLFGWPSVTKGLECVAWAFFLGLAMLFASKALEELGSKAITWTMRICGILTLAGLVGPIIGNMNYYMMSTIGYSVGFLVISIEMIAYFNRRKA